MTVSAAEVGKEEACNDVPSAGDGLAVQAERRAWHATPTKEEEQASHLDDLRHQSSEKLRRAWDSIYTRFQDAHLQVQDEIYLGRQSVKGDRMRVLRDRGHLRALPNASLPFGSIYLDKAELIGFSVVQGVASDASDSAAEKVKKEEEEEAATITPTQPKPQEARIDPYLQEFLEAEAERKRLCGGVDDDDDDESDGLAGDAEEDVFDGGKVHASKDPGKGRWRNNPKSDHHSPPFYNESEEEEDDIEVYSLAKGPLFKAHETSSSSLSALSRSTSEEGSMRTLTPPTSSSSTPNIHEAKGGKTGVLAFHPNMTPSRSPAAPQKLASGLTHSSSTAKKRKQGSVLLPKWESSSPKTKRKTDKDEDACSGESRCTKSMCMICGGFSRRAADDTEEE